MPNGRGHIDCGYCLHWAIDEEEWGYESGGHDGTCNCWDAAIPRSLTIEHKFCLDFEPSIHFGEDNGVGLHWQTKSTQEVAQTVMKKYLEAYPRMAIGTLYSGGLDAGGRIVIQAILKLEEL